MSFSERLLELFPGKSMAEIARELEVPHSTIRNYVQKNRLPAADVLITIVNRTNVSLNWLLTGKGSKATSGSLTIVDLLDKDEMFETKRLWIEWKKAYEQDISLEDFLRLLLFEGRMRQSFEEDEAKVESDFDTEAYELNTAYVLKRTILQIIRNELGWGESRDIIEGVVRQSLKEISPSSTVQELDVIDEFDVAAAVKKYDNALPVIRDWLAYERHPIPVNLAQFRPSGWDRMNFDEKVEQVIAIKGIIDRQRKRQRDVPPKDT